MSSATFDLSKLVFGNFLVNFQTFFYFMNNFKWIFSNNLRIFFKLHQFISVWDELKKNFLQLLLIFCYVSLGKIRTWRKMFQNFERLIYYFLHICIIPSNYSSQKFKQEVIQIFISLTSNLSESFVDTSQYLRSFFQ